MEVDPGNQTEQEQGGASDPEGWEHDGSVVVPKAKAKGQAKAKAKSKAVKTIKTKGAGGKRESLLPAAFARTVLFQSTQGPDFAQPMITRGLGITWCIKEGQGRTSQRKKRRLSMMQ